MSGWHVDIWFQLNYICHKLHSIEFLWGKSMAKSVQISFRISHDAAEFLSGLKVEGAKTPSDKMRAILEEYRKKHSQLKEFIGCFKFLQEQLAPVTEIIRKAEVDHKKHSEVLARTLDWLPDFFAFLVSSVFANPEGLNEENIKEVEQGVADRVFRIIESYLQMGITEKCPCYDPDLINEQIKPVLELMEIISRKRGQGSA